MSPPSGFGVWCAFRGYSEAPWEWDDAARLDYRDWRLARFRSWVRWMRDIGQWEIIRAQSGRDRLIQMVRARLDEALAPPPTMVYGRAEGRTPSRRDVGRHFPTLGPVTLGWYARMGEP